MTLNEVIPKANEKFRSGFVAIVGRPNVGKSTLMNHLIGQKIAITSPVAQTTRNRLRGILTTTDAQIIFVDTPGIHKPHHQLGKILVKKGDWIILKEKIASKLIQPEFEFLYENEKPVSGTGAVKMFCLRKNVFVGLEYEGSSKEIVDSRGSEVILECGDLVGTYESTITKNNFFVIKKDVKEKYFKSLE